MDDDDDTDAHRQTQDVRNNKPTTKLPSTTENHERYKVNDNLKETFVHRDTAHVYEDARKLKHVPWNSLFPKNSYLPNKQLLNVQHNSVNGNRFHFTHRDTHADTMTSPRLTPAGYFQLQANKMYQKLPDNHFQSALKKPLGIKTNNNISPYGHHTPYLGGMMSGRKDDGVIASLHGDLCVEKRDGICRRHQNNGKKAFFRNREIV